MATYLHNRSFAYKMKWPMRLLFLNCQNRISFVSLFSKHIMFLFVCLIVP